MRPPRPDWTRPDPVVLQRIADAWLKTAANWRAEGLKEPAARLERMALTICPTRQAS